MCNRTNVPEPASSAFHPRPLQRDSPVRHAVTLAADPTGPVPRSAPGRSGPRRSGPSRPAERGSGLPQALRVVPVRVTPLRVVPRRRYGGPERGSGLPQGPATSPRPRLRGVSAARPPEERYAGPWRRSARACSGTRRDPPHLKRRLGLHRRLRTGGSEPAAQPT